MLNMVEIFHCVAFYYLFFFACNVHTGNVSCLSTTQYGCGTKEAMLSGEKVIFLKRNTWLWALFNKSTSQFFMVCTLIKHRRNNVQNSSGTTSRWRVVSLQRFFLTVTSAVLTSISVKVTRRIAGQNRAREKEKNKWRHYHVISMVFSRI